MSRAEPPLTVDLAKRPIGDRRHGDNTGGDHDMQLDGCKHTRWRALLPRRKVLHTENGAA